MTCLCLSEEPLLNGGRDLEEGRDSDSNDGNDSPRSKKEAVAAKAQSLLSDLLYGLINAIVGIPTMISFAAIIFSVSHFWVVCHREKLATYGILWKVLYTVRVMAELDI